MGWDDLSLFVSVVTCMRRGFYAAWRVSLRLAVEE
jgi:hypothetical protein